MSQQWARLPERGQSAGTAIDLLDRPACRPIRRPCSTLSHHLYFLVTATAARRSSRRYLRRALGPRAGLAGSVSPYSLLRRHHSGSGLFPDWATGAIRDRIFGGQRILDQATSGRGCILLGVALGRFRRLAGARRELAPLPIKILMNTTHNRAMTQLLDALNPTLAQTIIPISAPDTLLKVQEAWSRAT